jgi:adenosylmethionine-8-amino-7-oxononanoate aminotransferase
LIKLKGAKGLYLITKSRRKILDASGGAAVSCLGHNNYKINKAIINQLNTGLTYHTPAMFKHNKAEALSKKLVISTSNNMNKVILANTGYNATEIAIKIAVLAPPFISKKMI